MRIILPTGIFPPDIGGPASYVPRIAAALAARGHAVEVVTLADDPACGEIYAFPVRRIARFQARITRMIETVAAIRHGALSADLIYANGLFIEAAIAAALAVKPLVMKIVGDWAWERARNQGAGDPILEEFQRRRQPLRWEAVKALRTMVTRRAEVVIAPSRFLAEVISGWGVPRARIEVVYNAPDELPAVEPADIPPFEGHTIITVARLVKWKGVDGLLELIRDRANLRLLVVGDGPERRALEALAGRLGIQQRALFLGSLPRKHVAECMRLADAFILNSSYEGLPHVLLEAFAAGVPVIATSAGGTVEIVESEQNGLLIPPGDGAALADALERLLSEPELRKTLVEGGRRTMQTRFRWDTLVAQTERILQEAAGGRTSA